MTDAFEWGIARRDSNGYDFDPPHRTRMTQEEASTWLEEWYEISRPGNDMFRIIRRPRVEWEIVDG